MARETQRVSVLLVDDDPVLVETLAKELHRHGHAVTGISSFYDALERLDAPGSTFDVLIADIHLDRGNGVALVRMARLRHPNIRTIYICGHHLDTPEVGELLAKPVSGDDLARAIERVLNDRQPT
jgi:DNA-binding NtrC family response regulator